MNSTVYDSTLKAQFATTISVALGQTQPYGEPRHGDKMIAISFLGSVVLLFCAIVVLLYWAVQAWRDTRYQRIICEEQGFPCPKAVWPQCELIAAEAIEKSHIEGHSPHVIEHSAPGPDFAGLK